MINPKMSTMIVPIIPSVGMGMSAMPTMLSIIDIADGTPLRAYAQLFPLQNSAPVVRKSLPGGRWVAPISKVGVWLLIYAIRKENQEKGA